MKYQKLPVIIEAEQFTEENKDRAFNFCGCNCSASFDNDGNPTMQIQTLEGAMTASLGDWIIRGIRGECYPCKPDIFEKTYVLVEEAK